MNIQEEFAMGTKLISLCHQGKNLMESRYLELLSIQVTV